MDSLVQDRIYKKIAVYDYQGVCSNSKNHYSALAHRLTVSIFLIAYVVNKSRFNCLILSPAPTIIVILDNYELFLACAAYILVRKLAV